MTIAVDFGRKASTKEGMHLQENTLFDLGVQVIQNVAQYPLHYVTYATQSLKLLRLRLDAFTRKYIGSHKMMPSTLHIICPIAMHLQSLKLLCPRV